MHQTKQTYVRRPRLLREPRISNDDGHSVIGAQVQVTHLYLSEPGIDGRRRWVASDEQADVFHSQASAFGAAVKQLQDEFYDERAAAVKAGESPKVYDFQEEHRLVTEYLRDGVVEIIRADDIEYTLKPHNPGFEFAPDFKIAPGPFDIGLS